MSDCYKEQYEDDDSTFEDDVATKLNTYANGFGQSINSEEVALNLDTNLFFKPDIMFVKWLIQYANGRMIIDVGAGQGHLVRMIKMLGGKAIGLEPNIDYMSMVTMRKAKNPNYDINEILPMDVQRAGTMIQGLGGDKTMLVFARPCHNGFVEEGLDIMPEGMEALYITLEENLEKYDDLGKYKNSAEHIGTMGISEDNEVVYSIKK